MKTAASMVPARVFVGLKKLALYPDTAKMKRAFLTFLRVDGDPEKAAVKVNRRYRALMWHKRDDPDFSKDWDAALQVHYDEIERRLDGADGEAASAIIDSVKQKKDPRLRFRAGEVLLRRRGHMTPTEKPVAAGQQVGVWASGDVYINALPPRTHPEPEEDDAIPVESEVVTEDVGDDD